MRKGEKERRKLAERGWRGGREIRKERKKRRGQKNEEMKREEKQHQINGEVLIQGTSSISC